MALITFCGTLAMHIFVPALPNASKDLGSGIHTMQMTISLYILGLAVGQLVYGSLSDRMGRRPVLLAGLAIYTVAGFCAAIAPSAEFLIVARLFQALGGCAGLVLARAIVRDTAGAQEAGKRLALMNLMVLVSPGVSPLLGGLLESTYGWRFIFLGLGFFGAACLILSAIFLRETAELAQSKGASSHYRLLMASPAFLAYAIGGGCATTSMYSFVAAAPFILTDQLHLATQYVGACIAVFISGTWIGSLLASKLIGRFELDRLLVAANLISLSAAFLLLVLVLSQAITVVTVIGLMFVFTFGAGLAAPIALTRAMSLHPTVIGSASGLYGFLQMGIGALSAGLAGLGGNPAIAVATILVVAGLFSQCAFWVARRRYQGHQ